MLDLYQLMNAIAEGPVTLIGHSLGAGVALQAAGVFPDSVKALVAIEGLGPPPRCCGDAAPTSGWRTGWAICARSRSASRANTRIIEEALERMRVANPHLSLDQARHLTIHGVRRNENGTYSWKFDNYTRATSPYLFNLKDATEIWGRIRCPTLLVRGDESWAGDWERDGRLDSFRTAELVTIRKAGHWVHHDQLAEFLAVVTSLPRLVSGDRGPGATRVARGADGADAIARRSRCALIEFNYIAADPAGGDGRRTRRAWQSGLPQV